MDKIIINIKSIFPFKSGAHGPRRGKEMKELEECTFRPKINLYYPTINNMQNYNFPENENDSYEYQNQSKNKKINFKFFNKN